MSMVRDMGRAIGEELRAYHNAKIHNSLDTWAPTININRRVHLVASKCARCRCNISLTGMICSETPVGGAMLNHRAKIRT